ncbi:MULTISPECIES: RNA ligase family protein [unclassified Mesorhizobium]|uniref:ATP-dependent DNA ligase n=1 Tax=unclassified Mesorhizobium TaxID=325217 RepID=UPI000FCC6414|nr:MULTISPECIES: RNA ligase family protein [unclassified Mesorhizobium]TGP18059.1 ATP-dependent DNA ligase [Mesorhizobium sp. M1D.F.Ca.ET.231.01.1.1]TGP25412.1 ATP-dependent DNA ligase [Mesorhizobium sp. M1D.F.Ca.ET.234.01.1.1]TGS37879.1 ATP-dependent DNA ligase [Mesorhizobium sp. M1D.F.Ca.ET.184.01.1.1]TGS58232.1 ATP-dependent DNA ligase [Mesorhizobium sp. M1D.F.Ca.ET.183.01.1.1]
MRKPAGGARLSFIRPMEPELVEQPPRGDEWSHEIKFDGYRTQMVKDADGIRLYTKTGVDWTMKYRPLAEEASAFDAESFIIEGEVIVTNEAGLSAFHALRSAITRRPQDLYLVAFDLLHLNGHDLRDMALKDRREVLQALIPAAGHVQFSEALPGAGDAVYHLACEAGLEGIVSKRVNSVYRSGATMNWRKVKCFIEKEMEIIGVKRETGKPAMVLMADKGRYMGGAFVTFKADKRQALWDLAQGKAGAPAPKGLAKEKAEWLTPGLLGRVKFLKGEEKLRHASLKDFWEQ